MSTRIESTQIPKSPEMLDQMHKDLFSKLEADAEKRDWHFQNIFEINYGGKSLEITINPINNIAFTYIEKSSDLKEVGATTLLYKVAKEFIQKITNGLNRELSYTLQTGNERMKAWAETSGKEIFMWDAIVDEPEKQWPYKFIKKFIPDKYE